MSDPFVPFDTVRGRVCETLESWTSSAAIECVYLVRDLFGRVRVSVSDAVEADKPSQEALHDLAANLQAALGRHGYPAGVAVLFVDSAMLVELREEARPVDPRFPDVYWVDRLITGGDWWKVADSHGESSATRYTLYSVKGGVGRSTTAAVLAFHLAERGERVLVVDLDLESPGLSSAMLDAGTSPKFGVTDWFVEDLVGQGVHVIDEMTTSPAWAQDFDGDVRVVPAHGAEPGEYLAKLGRVYLVTDVSWARRLECLLSQLEEKYEPSVVLLESRSGLHDISAATVADLGAQVLLFAVDAASHWTDYEILFRHWLSEGLAPKIRERLSIVSALTPELETEQYLQRFRMRAWDLFRNSLYDELAPPEHSGDEFSFDINDEAAPHNPIAIHWNRGLAAGTILHDDLDRPPVKQAYLGFLKRFEELIKVNRVEAP